MSALPRSAEARAENEACAAVVDELRALMVQEGIAPPLLKLCDELAGRIRLRAIRARLEEHAPRGEQRLREAQVEGGHGA